MKYVDPTGHKAEVADESDWELIWELQGEPGITDRIYRNGKGEILSSRIEKNEYGTVIANKYYRATDEFDHGVTKFYNSKGEEDKRRREYYEADNGTQLALEIVSFGLDFVPIIGDLKGIGEAIVGRDMAGNKLTFVERVLALACLSELRGIGKVANKVKDTAEGIRMMGNVRMVVKHLDEIDETVDGIGSVLGGLSRYAACFTGDTLILTKNGHKLIKDVRVGDEVYCINTDTGEKGLKKVEETFIRETNILVHIYVNGEHIKTTVEHPFWVVDKGWVEASQLKAGDTLLMYSGQTAFVEKIYEEKLEEIIDVFNFSVADWHTYLVTGKDILVHNNDSCIMGMPSSPILTRNVTKASELDGKMLKNLRNEGVIKSGGRSGGKRPYFGTPNSYVKTEAGHTLVYDSAGYLIYDISPERVKMCVWDKAPNGNMYSRDVKLIGPVPTDLLK